MTALTKQQAKVLDFIWSRVSKRKPPPTCREICTRFCWSSAEAAHAHLRALRRKGWIDSEKDAARGLRLTRAARKALSGIPLVELSEITKR